MYGVVEAGGTKFICAVGDGHAREYDRIQFPTTTPQETLGRVVQYFQEHEVEALSVASFGPIEIRKENPQYGYITNTPKRHWEQVNFLGTLKNVLDVPIAWTTDVNGSAFGEYIAANQRQEDIEVLVYYTVGTGVGAGIVNNGKFIGSLGHPEMGHVFVKRKPEDIKFHGICPFHGDCLEGLISGPTFEARLGRKGQDVPWSDPVWNIMAYYLAQAAIQTTLTIRPDRIVFGGGVVSEEFLKMVRTQFAQLLDGYVSVPPLKEYLTMPLLENNGSAIFGGLQMSRRIMEKEE
jgi:fructokinase